MRRIEGGLQPRRIAPSNATDEGQADERHDRPSQTTSLGPARDHDRPRPDARRADDPSDRRRTRARSRQARALAFRRVRRKGARAGWPHRARHSPRGQAGPRRGGAGGGIAALRPRAARRRRRVARCSARQNPRVGAGPLGRRGLHEPDRRRARSASRPPGSPNGPPTTPASARRSVSPNTRKSPGSSTSAGRSRSRTARGRR